MIETLVRQLGKTTAAFALQAQLPGALVGARPKEVSVMIAARGKGSDQSSRTVAVTDSISRVALAHLSNATTLLELEALTVLAVVLQSSFECYSLLWSKNSQDSGLTGNMNLFEPRRRHRPRHLLPRILDWHFPLMHSAVCG
jgi:hypothetical protein